MSHKRPPKLGRWAWLALFIAAATVLLTDANRFLAPGGEKYVNFLEPGSADLIPSFNAAMALLSHQNPYHDGVQRTPDPYAASRGEAQHLTYLYPPSHALLYVPLALAVRGDFRKAARIQFFVSLALLFVLSLSALDLLSAMVSVDRQVQLALLPLLAILLGLNPGNQLGLERGQSDLITAACCWGAVVAFRHERLATAAFLVVAGTLLKGYGVVLALGLLAVGLERTTWRATVAGATLALALLLAPVAFYLPDALKAYPVRAEMFWTGWTNQGFRNVVSSVWPARSELGQRVLVCFALSVALAAWLQLRRTVRARGTGDRRALWGSLFALASLTVPIGYSRNSIAYNSVILLPGAIVLLLAQERLVEGWSSVMQAAVGVWLAIAAFGLFAFSIDQAFGLEPAKFPLPTTGTAVVALLVLIGVASARAFARVGLSREER